MLLPPVEEVEVGSLSNTLEVSWQSAVVDLFEHIKDRNIVLRIVAVKQHDHRHAVCTGQPHLKPADGGSMDE